ncbi:Sperm-associated antigen 16 protein [Terramyces sp. JEL0728]|nr:Sperm-associated antigen 16 protein [Terramyces sp. JEL0728]
MNAVPPLPNKLPKVNPKKALSKESSLAEVGPKAYILEDAQLIAQDSDDDLEFEEIPVEPFDEMSDSDVEESLEQAVRNMHEKGAFGSTLEKGETGEKNEIALVKDPEVIDDYIRNYLSSKALLKSLDAFQNEWYEFQHKGKIAAEDIILVPNIYQQNQELSNSVQKLRVEVEIHKDIAVKARATYDKLRKERDFHRMHHKRVVQEKTKLISDIKKLKKHYEHYEPALTQLKNKYEIAMKEKMLAKLERDRLASKVANLESTIKNLERNGREPSAKKKKDGANSKDLNKLPAEDRENPYLDVELSAIKPERMRAQQHIQGHSLTISSMKFHPKKPILATVSDDKTWKLWSFPNGELMLSGQGHTDWLADCDFHPNGHLLATASGDSTIKIWDFAKGVATNTFTDHTQAVWSCAFHDLGNHLASGSMDHTAKLWDLTIGKCKQSFRGHADSVNHVGFQPYTNLLFTCSKDKTVSFWDARTAICSQTFFGHMNTINHGGTAFATCDADGAVKLWDLRMTQELESVHLGPQSANKLSFDPSGSYIGVTSNNGTVRFINTVETQKTREIKVNDDSTQAILFDNSGEYMIVSGNDGSFHIFQ